MNNIGPQKEVMLQEISTTFIFMLQKRILRKASTHFKPHVFKCLLSYLFQWTEFNLLRWGNDFSNIQPQSTFLYSLCTEPSGTAVFMELMLQPCLVGQNFAFHDFLSVVFLVFFFLFFFSPQTSLVSGLGQYNKLFHIVSPGHPPSQVLLLFCYSAQSM